MPERFLTVKRGDNVLLHQNIDADHKADLDTEKKTGNVTVTLTNEKRNKEVDERADVIPTEGFRFAEPEAKPERKRETIRSEEPAETPTRVSHAARPEPAETKTEHGLLRKRSKR